MAFDLIHHEFFQRSRVASLPRRGLSGANLRQLTCAFVTELSPAHDLRNAMICPLT